MYKLLGRLVLVTQKSGEVNNMFLPPEMGNPPRLFGKDVLITLVISLPTMIAGSLKITANDILSPVQALAVVQRI